MVGWGEVAVIVTLTPHTDFAPVPRVEIRIEEATEWDGGDADASGVEEVSGGSAGSTGPPLDGGSASIVSVTFPDGTDTITVWWTSEGRTGKVPGAVRRGFTTSFGHLDVEAGFDTQTTYEVECFAGSVSLGRQALGTVVLPWEGDVNGCIVQQPLNPYLYAEVVNLRGSWSELTYSSEGELVRPQGTVFPSLVSFGPFGGAESVPVSFGAPTREVAARVKATLGIQALDQRQAPVWLIRTHQGLLPRRFYGRVESVREVDINLRSGREWSRFESVLTEVARPAPGLQITPLSYDDLDVSYPDYDERDAAYASYDEMDTDWSLAGAAG